MRDAAAEFPDRFETGPVTVTRAGFGFVHLGGPRQRIEAEETWCVDAAGRLSVGEGEETCLAARNDIYLSPSLIRKFGLKSGDTVKCTWRARKGAERFRSAVDVVEVNGQIPG